MNKRKRDAIRYFEVYQRCKEELGMISTEVLQIVQNLGLAYRDLQWIINVKQTTQHDRGCSALGKMLLHATAKKLSTVASLFPDEAAVQVLVPVEKIDLEDGDIDEIVDEAEQQYDNDDEL